MTEGPDVPFEETRFTCPVCRRTLPWADMREGMRCGECVKPYMAGRRPSLCRSDLKHKWNDLYCANDPWRLE